MDETNYGKFYIDSRNDEEKTVELYNQMMDNLKHQNQVFKD